MKNREYICESFILIKPDGVRNVHIRHDIYEEVTKRELVIEGVDKYNLSARDVDLFWPLTRKSEVLNGLLKCYMLSGTVEILFLSGPNVIEVLKEIKALVRKKHGICKFENCLHTPADVLENEIQLRYLKNKYEEQIDYELLNEVAVKVWNLVREKGWKYNWICNNGEQYTVWLKDDNKNSIDDVATAITESLYKYPLEVAYILTLQVEIYGCIPVYRCNSKDKIDSVFNKLEQRGLSVVLETS